MSRALLVSKLTKSFRSGDDRIDVLCGLSLTVERGNLVAISGESGAGKSTLLHIVGGMEKPDSGTVFFGGQEVTLLEGDALARFRNRSVGFVFQFHHLLPEFTALENVMFPLLLRRVSFKEAEEKARILLDEVGLQDRATHQPGELSGGEQQRIAFARALIGEPQLLLGDEPTGNLDERTSESIHELLLSIHERHRLTSIIVTHNPRLAGICHTQKWMTGGVLS
ncbi:MAG: ABC transporter ATP-binding protein [Acidobacteriota bacterium]|nr:MAG: ABC transporter ATP-binding protein [Acidobacteriota bacterium]